MTNENGAFERSYFYGEFGNLMSNYGSVANHYLYTGQEYEGSITELYNLRARYYAPEIGRFVSEDPLLQINFNINCVPSSQLASLGISFIQIEIDLQ